jgi:bifunctional non-homologous end joining protein LigD
MALREYQRKRDFRRTAEPKGRSRRRRDEHLFVVQKHAARHLHYDLRLELDGVLKSWAVPKGPNADPNVKSLAVQVEDHPLEYGSFEGVIPPGEYGAGTVMLWDRGRWEPVGDPRQGLRDGKLTFLLAGQRLVGEWTLVRMRGRAGGDGKNWLLIKHHDQFAGPSTARLLDDARIRSVASDRTMDEIAADGDGAPGSSPRTRQGRADRTSKSKRAAPARRRKSSPRSSPDPSPLDPGRLPGAQARAQPKSLEPQLATLSKAAPRGGAWLHEIKFDGYRLLCVKRGNDVRLLTRRGLDWSRRFPHLVDACRHLAIDQCIVDGEVVVLLPDGRSDFQALQNLMSAAHTSQATYYAFDLPYAGGFDLTNVPLVERKKFLARLLRQSRAGREIEYSDHVVGNGPQVFSQACRMGLEGIVSKLADSPYLTVRSPDWLKVKCLTRQEFVVAGYTAPSGARSQFGALLLGYYDQDGKLTYCGRVGTGFSDESLRQVARQLHTRATARSPFDVGPSRAEARGASWVRPELVAEVEFREWTGDGRLRQPSFQGLREDKDPRSIGREQPQSPASIVQATSRRSLGQTGGAKRQITTARPARADASPDVAGVRITNAARVVYPQAELTKLDVARYYESVAQWILPGLVNRALTIVRCPTGLAGKCFYQKHVRGTLPPPVRGADVEEPDGIAHYVAIDDLAGLITLVQFGAMELHPWGSRLDRIEKPDLLVFDLDPAAGVPWRSVIEAARRLRAILVDLGLTSFVRTTGGKGLHVVLPIARTADWDRAKHFARYVAHGMTARWPDTYLATAGKDERRGKIYIDYLRNGRGATAIASYSARARPLATVATPLAWDELSPRLTPDHFRIANVPRRLAALAGDPWAGFATLRQSLAQGVFDEAKALAHSAPAR